MTADAHPRLPRHQQKAARRSQLLDAAVVLLESTGSTRFTMEALAAQAGVSKALPYQHFENATDVIAALYERELGRVGAAIDTATKHLSNGNDALAAAVNAYFGVLEERGPVLVRLAGTGSPIPSMLFGPFPPPPTFLVELIERGFGSDRRTANALAAMVSSIAIAASDIVARGDGSRDELESMATRSVIAAVNASLDVNNARYHHPKV